MKALADLFRRRIKFIFPTQEIYGGEKDGKLASRYDDVVLSQPNLRKSPNSNSDVNSESNRNCNDDRQGKGGDNREFS